MKTYENDPFAFGRPIFALKVERLCGLSFLAAEDKSIPTSLALR